MTYLLNCFISALQKHALEWARHHINRINKCTRNRGNTSNTNKQPIKVTILRSSTCLDVVNQLPKGIRMYYNQNKNSYYITLILSNVIYYDYVNRLI